MPAFPLSSFERTDTKVEVLYKAEKESLLFSAIPKAWRPLVKFFCCSLSAPWLYLPIIYHSSRASFSYLKKQCLYRHRLVCQVSFNSSKMFDSKFVRTRSSGLRQVNASSHLVHIQTPHFTHTSKNGKQRKIQIHTKKLRKTSEIPIKKHQHEQPRRSKTIHIKNRRKQRLQKEPLPSLQQILPILQHKMGNAVIYPKS